MLRSASSLWAFNCAIAQPDCVNLLTSIVGDLLQESSPPEMHASFRQFGIWRAHQLPE